MKRLSRIVVTTRSGPDRSFGRLRAGALAIPCRLGPTGAIHNKREGDGGTPVGRWRILGLQYRADRLRLSGTILPARASRPNDGWCDDPTSQLYNHPLVLPARLSHETMWRDDHVYDIVLLLDHNRRPRVLGAGSAIFLHLTRDPPTPTAGCIAIPAQALRRLLPRLARHCIVEIR